MPLHLHKSYFEWQQIAYIFSVDVLILIADCIGTAESPVLRSLKYSENESKKCFSVVSNTDKMYDFEAASQEDRDMWVRGLFYILKYNT